MKYATQLSRVFTGVLFILSGFIKANDTLGFSYKLEEYFEIFHKEFPLPQFLGFDWMSFAAMAEPLSMFICIFEILCGVALLLGAFARLNAWLLLVMIVFFTVLTGYSAITNKVTDCGCFGDAIKLKPIESFFKDLFLLLMILFIFFGVKNIKPLFNKTIQNILLSVALLVSTFFTFYTFMFLPRIDFLPYKIGNDITEKMKCPVGSPTDSFAMVFIYEKNGVKEEFDMNHLPSDTNYKFVDRIDKQVRVGCKPPIHDFVIYDENGIDFTDSLFAKDEYKLVLIQKNSKDGRQGLEKQMAALANDWTQQSHLQFWALSNTSHDEIEAYRHEHQLSFPYYLVDGTPLKSMIRSSPGLILMKKSTVVKKWSAYNFPDYSIVLKYMK